MKKGDKLLKLKEITENVALLAILSLQILNRKSVLGFHKINNPTIE
jgi:hypothetical protein